MSLIKKLKNFGMGSAIAISSLLPMKSLGQESADNANQMQTIPKISYYFDLAASFKTSNNSLIQEYFNGGPFGIKTGIGVYLGHSKRIELEGGWFSRKSGALKTKFSNLEFGGYYDIILRPTENFAVYGGAGLRAESWNFDIKNES